MAAFLENLLGFAGRLTIGEVAVDASISEAHQLEADITEHPVEAGSDIVDNYRAKPRTLQIEGIVSSTPIATGYPGQSTVQSVQNIIKNDDPVQNAWGVLKGYVNEGELITISTSLEEYPNVAIVSINATRDSKNGQVLRFTCSVRQVRTVTTDEADAIDIPEPEQTEASKEKSEGKKPSKEGTEGDDRTGLAKLTDKGASFFGL